MIKFSPLLKDRLIFAGWIAGLVIASFLLWSFTSSFRSRLLINSVNHSLDLQEDSIQLSGVYDSPVTGSITSKNLYTISNSNSLFVVFTIMWDGILVPLGAQIEGDGEISQIIPIGNHAKQIAVRIPKEQIDVYIHRIKTLYKGNL